MENVKIRSNRITATLFLTDNKTIAIRYNKTMVTCDNKTVAMRDNKTVAMCDNKIIVMRDKFLLFRSEGQAIRELSSPSSLLLKALFLCVGRR